VPAAVQPQIDEDIDFVLTNLLGQLLVTQAFGCPPIFATRQQTITHMIFRPPVAVAEDPE
jgi:hypothetical protein